MPLNNLKKTFRDKRVLITGHTGFKGAWLSAILNDFGAEVTGYALAPEKDLCLYTICQLENRITSRIANILDENKLIRVIEECQPEVVFHLAAQPLVLKAYQDPVTTYQTNVLGVLNLFEACRRHPSVRAIINVTTDKCYDNTSHEKPHKESDKLGGHDPYSSSKACSEILTESYRKSFFNFNGSENKLTNQVALSSARAGNVIGGGDWADYRIIPDCIRHLMARESILVRNPSAVRPWQHVLDCLSGYLVLAQAMLADPEKYSQAWNFGPHGNQEAKVVDLVDMVISQWGSGDFIQDTSGAPFHESKLLNLDSTKASRQLGWNPKWDWSEAVHHTITWYKEYQDSNGDSQHMFNTTLKQIKKYFS